MENFELYSNDGMHHFYKIYNDGGHFVGTLLNKKTSDKKMNCGRDKKPLDYLFDELYFYCVQNNIHGKNMFDYIYNEIAETNGIKLSWVEDYVKDKIKQKYQIKEEDNVLE